MRAQLCKEGADVSLYRLFYQLNMAGYPTERVPSSLSFDVSQRYSVVLTSRKIEITVPAATERVVNKRSKSATR